MSKFTNPEKSWILYDVANSAFTMLISTTIPIFFRSLAEQDVSASTASGIWALTTSVAVLILAVLSPFLGALADYKGMKKKMFSLFLVVGVIGLLLLSFSGNWISYMILFVITRIGYSACNIFYDSMLVDVTADDRMDRISSYGYALGYIGSCIPFIIGILLILVRPFGLSTQAATQISFGHHRAVVGWLTIPLLKNVPPDTLFGKSLQSGQSRSFPYWTNLKENSQKSFCSLFYHRLFLLYRRRVHHHLDGNHLRR